MKNIIKLIQNRITNLELEKQDLLTLLDLHENQEDYITLRLCYINERIHELQDLIDDILYGEVYEKED